MATSRATRIRLVGLVALLLSLLGAAHAWNPNLPYYGAGLRVPFTSLKTLTFYAGRKTAYRRTSPLPQLTCVGSPCSRYEPDVVQCQSMGDGQWKCMADLPSSMRMGRVEVSCEGYDYADDPYVLKDSCALTYHLIPTGRERDDPWKANTYRRAGARMGWGERLVEALFQIMFWGILAAIVISFVRAVRGSAGANGSAAGRGGGGWGGWGGGGGNGWWPGGGGGGFPYNPPPPYSPKPDPDSTASSSWRPGFWTGLGLGGLAATAAASRRRNTGYGYVPEPGYGYGLGGGGFGGGFGGAGPSGHRRGTRFDDDDVGFGGMRESTGFGGTRNR